MEIAPLLGYTVRLAYESEFNHLPNVERAAAQRFLPYLEQLEIPVALIEGLTPLQFLRRAQLENRLWVAVPTQEADQTITSSQKEAQQQPVGFLVAKFLPEGCFVVELSVHPTHGRMGLGSALVEACCEGARSRGADRILLTTFRHVPWNIPFYQKLGFEILPAEKWSPDISAIVDHETRYGFAQKHRAVMMRMLSSNTLAGVESGAEGWTDGKYR
ncbi:MAG: GNAT family N-acetyltransferase [Cyanobacteria bacterium J06632_3]